jgi:hypothetical protein
MAQAKAKRTLPFFPGSTASGSAAEAIVDGLLLCSVLYCRLDADGLLVVLCAVRSVVFYLKDAIYRQEEAGSPVGSIQASFKRRTGKKYGPTCGHCWCGPLLLRLQLQTPASY